MNATDEPGIGHNATEMKRDLLLAAEEIGKIDAEIAELRERKNEIKHEKVKAHGIKLADFNTVARWWKLEGDDRNATLDEGMPGMRRYRAAGGPGIPALRLSMAVGRERSRRRRQPRATRRFRHVGGRPSSAGPICSATTRRSSPTVSMPGVASSRSG